ncbi:MAG: Cell cycle checkpoint protein rad17 [Alyxoria varia]|nr:MAG: Cell cycle checkpoint protein rad17 [Alyxoria varia]
MVRPQTRSKKNVIPPSDDESDSNERTAKDLAARPSTSQEVDSQRSQKFTIRPHPSQPSSADSVPAPKRKATPNSRNNTPQKPSRTKTQPDAQNDSTTRTLHSFFGTATRDQVFASRGPQKANQEKENEPWDDVIEDDFSDCLYPSPKKTINQNPDSSVPRKRSRNGNDAGRGDGILSAGPKFLKANGGRRVSSPTQRPQTVQGHDLRPWTEKYGPQNVEELVVHHKKVENVRNWLEVVLNGKNPQKLLVLKGPAGAGKTTTVSLLSKVLGFKIVEWKNPSASDFTGDDYVSVSSLLEDFMSRAGKYGGLELAHKHHRKDTPPNSARSQSEQNEDEQRVIMLEDLPSVTGRSSTGLMNFRNKMLQYLAEHARPSYPTFQKDRSSTVAPIVLVISESFVSTANAFENYTAHRILGHEILHHPGTFVIEFNSVAPTFINKALNLVLQKSSQGIVPSETPGPQVLQRLSETGDVRNAVSTLELLCCRQSAQGVTGQTARKTDIKSKSGAKKTKAEIKKQPISSEDNATLSLISSRETTLGLFHSVGKVVYNKRVGEDSSSTTTTPRAKGTNTWPGSDVRPPIETDLDYLQDLSGTDTSTFLSALHENYVLSCNSPSDDSEATLNSIYDCVDSLSDADMQGMFSGGLEGGRNRSFMPTAAEGFRQKEMAFQVGVRGMMRALPWPVKRSSVSFSSAPRKGSGGGGEAFRMFYPTDIKLWRKREEILDTVDYLVTRTLHGQLVSGDERPLESKTITQAGRMSQTQSSTKLGQDKNPEDDDSSYVSLSSGESARKTILQLQLPYMKRLLEVGALKAASPRLERDIEQVTRFDGIGVSAAEQDLEDDDLDSNRSGLKQGTAASVTAFGMGEGGQGMDQEVEMEKLVLSDDDIEDD